MRTRSRARKESQAPVNITVNIHIHLDGHTSMSQVVLPENLPPPRYFTRFQRQRALTTLPPGKQIVPTLPTIPEIKAKRSTVQQAHAAENPKPKRRRVDVDALTSELTSMAVGTKNSSSLVVHTKPKNPFDTFIPPPSNQETQAIQCFQRFQLTTPASNECDDLVQALQSIEICPAPKELDDAAVDQFRNLSLCEPKQLVAASESSFLHHLMQRRLSLHG
ncbi:hypothetical protein Ae201684P_011913 [Aphanomyces euteiches]|uniref:Uncharacterized protein n=1 Tax=Aphanomyces euteiches TaxID=100861 RepID=A0A6G0WU37_9STRA|nr:hypothetical protein Ae201684_011564 [Aphanomyces euteiches]KAH9097189.1 hypothetical protein Ae201684P_011913 [Aphanomyces euteiches]KAH9143538.1 hypothetical protein AeRB84_012456 [Aphanomyces euteiches]